MTWVGKILAVLVLLLGIAWMWFTVSVFVTRTNWKNDRDAYKRLYEEAKTARQTELDFYRTEKDALERQLLAEQTRSKGLNDQVATLQKGNEETGKTIASLNKTVKDNDVTATELQARLQALTDEVKKTRDRNTDLETERVKLVVDREVALKDRQAFENLVKTAQAETLLANQKIERLTGELAEAKATGGSADRAVIRSFDKPPAALPEGVRGTVTAYREGYVALSIGIDAGLTNGAVLDIYRSEGGGQYLGTVVVDRVYPKEAVAVFKPADVRVPVNKLRPEQLPKVGDTVGKVGGGSVSPISLK